VRYNVYIEGARDPGPNARTRLAAALAERYGLAATTVAERLARGSFCAWASIELDVARRLVSEVEALGARTSVIQDGAPMSGAGRQTARGLPPPPASRPPPAYASGLAAAYAGQEVRSDVEFDLGALQGEGEASGSWHLARLDGSEERTAESPALTRAALAADRAQTRPGAAGPAPAAVDPFAPPDAGREEDLELEAAPAWPGTVAEEAASQSLAAGSSTGVQVASSSIFRGGAPAPGSASLHRGSPWQRFRESMAGSARSRFAAGVTVAFLIGLIPAQIVAAARSAGAYDEIRAELGAEYARADTPEAWATLDGARSDAQALVTSRQRRIAITSCVIWLLVGGAVAFVWFRRIDWAGSTPRLAPAQPADAAAASRRRVMK
jgi:hypothetical protein